MAASKEGLIDNINCKLTAGGLTDIQASQLAGAAQALCCSSFYAVPCCACLPSATANKGRFVYIQDIGRYRYSNGYSWINCYSSVVTETSNIYSWGSVGFAAGNGGFVSCCLPVPAGTGIRNWSSISVGSNSSMALRSDNTLWTWGANASGQLGDGSTTSRCSPVTTAGGGTNWCAISTGDCHSVAIKIDGTLWTWGKNNFGQLGDGSTTSRSSPGTVAGGGTTWCAVSAGVAVTAAIKTDGTLWTWGWNCGLSGTIAGGGLGDGTTTNRCSPGTTAGGGTNWCAVSSFGVGCYGSAMAAIKTDGTLWTWGDNSFGLLGTGDTSCRSSPATVSGGGTTWCAVSMGQSSTAAGIKTDGTLWTWGNNQCGSLGESSTTSRSSPGTTTGGGTTWCAVSVNRASNFGRSFMLALKTDGTLWAWGDNGPYTLGDGTTTNRSSPAQITTPTGAVWLKISAGSCSGNALKTVATGF